MNAIVKVGVAVMTFRAQTSLVSVVRKIAHAVFASVRNLFTSASTLTIGHLRNGGTSISSVTPDFI